MPRALTKAEVTDFRERLCDVAARLFYTWGRQGFTLRELAAELGVSPMTPYRYFKDKDAILAAVRARAFDKFSRALEDAYTGPGDALRAPAPRAKPISASPSRTPPPTSSCSISRRTTPPIRARPRRGARAADADAAHSSTGGGGNPRRRPRAYRACLLAMLHGAVMLRLAGKLDCDFTAMVGEAFRALVSGLRPKTK